MKKLSVLFVFVLFIVMNFSTLSIACNICGNPAHNPAIESSGPTTINIVGMPNMNVAGDLRLRYDGHDINGEYDDNESYRIRIGFGLVVNSKTMVSLGMKSESDIDGDGSGQINLDVAGVSYYFNDELTLSAGKTIPSFYQPIGTELLLDDDVRLEGYSATYRTDVGSLDLMLNTGYYNDVMAGVQLTTGFDLMDLEIVAGGGYFDYADAEVNYEAFAEVHMDLLTVAGDYLWNDDVEAWLVGVKTNVGPFGVYANYRSIEDGSINENLTDTHYINDGHEVGFTYTFAPNIVADVNILTEDFDDENFQIRSDLTFGF